MISRNEGRVAMRGQIADNGLITPSSPSSSVPLHYRRQQRSPVASFNERTCYKSYRDTIGGQITRMKLSNGSKAGIELTIYTRSSRDSYGAGSSGTRLVILFIRIINRDARFLRGGAIASIS